MNAIKLGFLLIIIGFAVVLTGMLLSARKADFAGLILIGPIPIAFGTSPEITLIAMAIGLFMIVFWVITRSVQQDVELEPPEKREAKVKGGGVIMIGPLPIIFGSDKRYAMIAMVLAIVILLLMIVFLK